MSPKVLLSLSQRLLIYAIKSITLSGPAGCSGGWVSHVSVHQTLSDESIRLCLRSAGGKGLETLPWCFEVRKPGKYRQIASSLWRDGPAWHKLLAETQHRVCLLCFKSDPPDLILLIVCFPGPYFSRAKPGSVQFTSLLLAAFLLTSQ